ncbi:hypothetical protein [Ferrovum myxofaciens]|uniref:hypothetical protein n=1 Tax=Ferrovum myxofaciens TaxID=416213 RepID=UPI003EC0B3A9
MTPATIIREAQSEGVRLAITPTGRIKVTGDGAAVNRWLAVIREFKPKIIEALKGCAGETTTASRWWLIHHPDRDPIKVSCTPPATHAEILEWHPDAVAAQPFTPTIREPSAPLTTSEESAIRAWLSMINESDQTTIAEVTEQCQKDANARDYFTSRSTAELPKPDPIPDDLRTCKQCSNLVARRCQAAKRGMIVASRIYEPDPDLATNAGRFCTKKKENDSEET